MFGTPVRRHVSSSFVSPSSLPPCSWNIDLQLNPSTRQRLLEEINDVLSSMMEFLRGGRFIPRSIKPLFIRLFTAQLSGSVETDSFGILPDEIQTLKDGIQSKQREIDEQSQRIINQILEISLVNLNSYTTNGPSKHSYLESDT